MANEREKYIEVKPVIHGYPKPQPARQKRREIFQENIETQRIASEVEEVVVDKDLTFKDLVELLTRHLSSDVMKTWALFCWAGAQVTSEKNNTDLSDSEEGTPLWYSIKMRNLHVGSFATVMAVALREANIPCVIITGKAKGAAYEVGDATMPGESFWNAVYVDGGWHLLHAQWAFQSITGHEKNHWIKVERDGHQIEEDVQPSSGNVVSYKNTFYFLTDPELFKYYFRPYDNQMVWQLLQIPVSQEMFMKLPLIFPPFFTSGARFKFRRGQSNTIIANQGEAELIIMVENQKWAGHLGYELFYKPESGKTFPSDASAEKYVILCNKNLQNEIKFLIRFPVAGTYRLSILDPLIAKWLCEFRLVCDKPRAHCDPLPLNPEIGWGPGEATRQQGLTSPSHNDGIVKTKKDEKLEISFNTKDDTKIKAKLKHNKKPDGELEKYITKKQFHCTVSIKLDLPDNDEYALVIDAKVPQEKFKNALNYIITTANKSQRQALCYANPTEKRLVKSLETAIKGKDKDSLQAAIDKFKKQGIENNNILSEATDRVEFLKLKIDLQRAIGGGRIDNLEKAINNASSSKHADRLSHVIERANKVVYDIRRNSWASRHDPKRVRNESIYFSPRRPPPPL